MSRDQPTGDGDVIVYEQDAYWHAKRIKEMTVMLGLLEKRADRLKDPQVGERAVNLCRNARTILAELKKALDANEGD